MEKIIIDVNNANQRLDKFCLRHLGKPPKSFVHKLLRKKAITVNGAKADGSYMLAVGDAVCFYISDETQNKFAAETRVYPKGDVNIVFEDGDIIVLNKPANLLTQPNEAGGDSLITRLFNHETHKDQGGFMPVAINRLDRNTTGLVLCARNLPTAQRLSKMVHDRKMGKAYLAVAMGRVEGGITLDGGIIKDEGQNVSQIVPRGTLDSKEVSTQILPQRYYEKADVTPLKIYLHTGRSHQIRAHLQSIGHPLVGDKKYGGSGAKRQLLHAYELVLDDGCSFTAPLPDDMRKYFDGII